MGACVPMLALCPAAGKGLGPVDLCVSGGLCAARLFAGCIVCRCCELRQVRCVRSNQKYFNYVFSLFLTGQFFQSCM